MSKYLGTWYEIQRFPHSFEKDLSCVTANYSMKPNGEISVKNSGKKDGATAFKQAEGRAWVPDADAPGRLKVSFFGPFAGDYQVMALGDDYDYALIGAPNKDYLWILARTPTLDSSVTQQLRTEAANQGFDLSRLENVTQNCW